MNLILLIGVPSSGKTTLYKRLITSKTVYKFGLIKFHKELDYWVIGDYSEDMEFSGTDRLSMASPRDLFKFLLFAKKQIKNIYIEGDRLITSTMISKLSEFGFTYKLFYLSITDETLSLRQESRNQNKTFVTGRATKIKNIIDTFPHYVLLSDSVSNIEENFLKLKDCSYDKVNHE